MADTDPVNFSRSAARQIRESVRVTQRLAHGGSGKDRRYPIPEDGNPFGTERVVFTIDSYDDTTGIATCTVQYRSCGVSTASGEDEYGKIEVIDPKGCLFDEYPDDLVGRWGDADYMQPTVDIDPYQECVWVVSGLCCPP